MRCAIAFGLSACLIVVSCGSSSDEGEPPGGGAGSGGSAGGSDSAGSGGSAGSPDSAGGNGALGSGGFAGEGGSNAGGGAAGSGGAALVDVETFSALYAEGFCAAQAACCGAAGGQVSASCEAAVEAAVSALLEEETAAPYREFSAPRAESCLAALAVAQGCAWRDITIACGRVIVGTIEPGEACDSVSDCAPPAAGYAGCSELGGAEPKRCRQFSAVGQEGDSCFDGAPFDGDEGVVATCGAGLRCEQGECAPAPPDESPALGESCDPEGAPCAFGGSCVEGECAQRPLLEQLANALTCEL